MTKKVFIQTYGCQMNVYDSVRMADVLAPIGFTETQAKEDADLIILNTCHIREKAAEKVYSELGRIREMSKRREAEEGKRTMIAVGGCVAQAEGEEIIRRMPYVDIVMGSQSYHHLPRLVFEAEKKSGVVELEFPEVQKFDLLPESTHAQGPAAYVAVQEGCDKFCTFCVVPYTRGAEYSRPVAAIEKEVRDLVENKGAIEITLLGQNVNAYHGADYNNLSSRTLDESKSVGFGNESYDPGSRDAATLSGSRIAHFSNRSEAAGKSGFRDDSKILSLAGLIHRLAKIDGLQRIRYTTSHPCDMTDDLIQAHGEIEKLMPYMHLPIQSGSDRILKAMNRKHTAAEYLAIVDKLRKVRPDIAMSSDFIVGFPGETDADFEDTLKLVASVGYASAYSFKYSLRPGTPAAENENQLPEEVKDERLQRLQSLLRRQHEAFNRTTIGKILPVLLEREGKRPNQLIGRSPYMQSVCVENAVHLKGRLVNVRITSASANSVSGEVVGNIRLAS